jgi:putative transposase
MTWISTERAMELLGVKRSRLFEMISRQEIVTRSTEKGRNGKPRREIELESLPSEKQKQVNDCPRPAGNRTADEDDDESRLLAATGKLSGLNEARLAEALRRNEAIRAALEARPENVKFAKENGAARIGVSLRRFNQLINEFKSKKTITSLVRDERRDKGKRRCLDDKAMARIRVLYLKLYRPDVASVYRAVAEDFEMSGLKAPSYSSVRRVIKGIDPDLVARFRIGEREFDNKFAYITLRKRPPLPRQWCDFDHHEIDHYVLFPDGKPGRPWVTVAHDICTGEILGYHIPPDKKVGDGRYPGADAICLALRHAILKKEDPSWPSFGVFDHLYADLGADFRSKQVRAVCADLGIEIVHTRGFHGKSKPVERWFGVMENALRHLAGYCGRKPDQNPYRQGLKPEAPDPKNLLTLDKFESELRRWIITEYHATESRALGGLSPLGALQAHVSRGFSAREVRDERVLDLLLMRRSNRMVKNYGIEAFSSLGDRRYFMADELTPLIGQRVDIAWDPAKLGEILIYQGARFVCKAQNRELLDFGASEATLKRERELKRDQRRLVTERHQRLLMEAQYPNEMARAAAEERRESVLGEERLKMAAGAEADGIPVLLPKYAQASKRLRAVKSSADSHDAAVNKKEKENPWLDFESSVAKCHKCGRDETFRTFYHCLDCVFGEEGSCDVCKGSGAHRYCEVCTGDHPHTNPGTCEGCGDTGPTLEECLSHEFEANTRCATCHGIGPHRFCSACLEGPDHEGHNIPILGVRRSAYANEDEDLPTAFPERDATPGLDSDDEL